MNKAEFFSFKILSHQCRLCIIWNWFIQKVILILKKYVFRLFKMAANQMVLLA